MKFQPKVLQFDGGYLTYCFNKKCVDISPNQEDAFIFTTKNNYEAILWNLGYYTNGYPCGFESVEEENKWKNPRWIDVFVNVCHFPKGV